MKAEVVLDLNHLSWPALLVDEQGFILQANQAAQSIFGAPLTPGTSQLATIWAGENSMDAQTFLKRAREGPSGPVLEPLKFRLVGGVLANYLAALCPAESLDSRRWVLQLLADKTGAGTTAQTVADPAHLQQKLDCMLQLAQTVSLDFNNALTGILAHTSLLLGKAEAGHPWRTSLGEVQKSAARAAEIAGDLAHFSRQDKKARQIPAGNLNAVVTRCVGQAGKARGPRIAWNLILEKSLLEARFDEPKMEQALMKVLENAMESHGSSQDGSIVVQTRNVQLSQPSQDVNVRLNQPQYVCIEVLDEGEGVEAGIMPRIFEPFFTTKAAPHRGLGLALVYGILSNHGGGVALSSQPGKGTSARLYIPAEKTHVPDMAVTTDALGGTGTVLVVDDEPLLLNMAQTILGDFGYRVLTAGNGAAALELLRDPSHHIDLVITDMVMPGMGGRELMDRIRQMSQAVPILCTSGHVFPPESRPGTDYLAKPFTSVELLSKVKNTLRRHKTSQEGS